MGDVHFFSILDYAILWRKSHKNYRMVTVTASKLVFNLKIKRSRLLSLHFINLNLDRATCSSILYMQTFISYPLPCLRCVYFQYCYVYLFLNYSRRLNWHGS